MDLAYAGFNNPAFHPSEGVTHCNEFIQSICVAFGYDNFTGLMANDIVNVMRDPSRGWISVDSDVAQSHANNGILVVAGWANPDGHGHVALIIPGIVEWSQSYQGNLPKCVSIGSPQATFFGKKVSFAFVASQSPKFYALAEMI